MMSECPKRPPPPEWINTNFVQHSLNNEESHRKEVMGSVNVDYACSEGSGYASQMFRVTASVREEGTNQTIQIHLLVKCSAIEGQLKEEVDKLQAFKVESMVLSGIMPEIHKVLSSVEDEAFRPLTACCFHWGKQPVDFLVLEDLAEAGFTLAEADRPLDYQHCRVVLRAYARLHAASVRVLKEKTEYMDHFGPDQMAAAADYLRQVSEVTFPAVARELKGCTGYERYADRYQQICDSTVDKVLHLRTNKNVKLLVLLHGDCWRNNVMFKYTAGKVTEARLVDFQISTTCSPAADVVHFLYSSASAEVHQNHLDSLLAEYHELLQTTLRALGMSTEADTYSLQEFKDDIDRFMPIGVLFSTFHVFCLASGALGSEISNFLNDVKRSDELFAKAYRNPYSLPYLKSTTLLFERKGLL